MRKVYVIQTGSHDRTRDRFEFYDVEVFSSKAKMLASIENRIIDCNKGYDIIKEKTDLNSHLEHTMITYKCL